MYSLHALHDAPRPASEDFTYSSTIFCVFSSYVIRKFTPVYAIVTLGSITFISLPRSFLNVHRFVKNFKIPLYASNLSRFKELSTWTIVSKEDDLLGRQRGEETC